MTNDTKRRRVRVRILSGPQIMLSLSGEYEINFVVELVDPKDYEFGGDFEKRFYAVVFQSNKRDLPQIGTEVEVTEYPDWYCKPDNPVTRLCYVD